MADFFREEWKPIRIDVEYTNKVNFEISNYGRLRSFNKSPEGEILKGSMTNGYPILRLSLIKPRAETLQKEFDYLEEQISMLTQKIKDLRKSKADPEVIIESRNLRDGLKKSFFQKVKSDKKRRIVRYHALIHRLVADYFIPKPPPDHTLVAHIDHDKTNNHVNNLKWMRPEENYEHQKKSPIVIRKQEEIKNQRKEDFKNTKLTVTKVMLLKKLLNQGKPIRQLVKQFKITDTQIFRIKRGENWGDIQAAE